MATIKWNNGNFQEVSLERLDSKAKIFLSVDVIPDDEVIKIAGHSVIDCLNMDIQDVIFKPFQIGNVSKLLWQNCSVEVNVSKIKANQSAIDGSKVPITCVLKILAGGIVIEEFELNDRKKLSSNSVFIYKIKF